MWKKEDGAYFKETVYSIISQIPGKAEENHKKKISQNF